MTETRCSHSVKFGELPFSDDVHLLGRENFHLFDNFYRHLVPLRIKMRCRSTFYSDKHTHTHTLLGCPPTLKQRADNAAGRPACHTVAAGQRSRAKERAGLILDAWRVEFR